MKRPAAFLLVFVFSLLFILPVTAAGSDGQKQSPAFVYKDPETGLTFTVPAGWVQKEVSEDREYVRAKFVRSPENGSVIVYSSGDLWSALSEDDKAGLRPSDIDSNTISLSDMADIFGINKEDLRAATYNGKQFFKFNTDTSVEGQATTLSNYVCLDNGYMYLFQINSSTKKKDINAFVGLISSIQYPAASVTGNAGAGTPYDGPSPLLAGLLLTVIIHPVPIWIYRYGIRKAPFSPKKARKIAFFDALIVFLVMSAIPSAPGSGGVNMLAIFLWSFLCYAALKDGYVSPEDIPSAEPEIAPKSESVLQDAPPAPQAVVPCQSDTISPDFSDDVQPSATAPKIQFCRYCGTKLVEGSKYCNNCGKRIK